MRQQTISILEHKPYSNKQKKGSYQLQIKTQPYIVSDQNTTILADQLQIEIKYTFHQNLLVDQLHNAH